MSVREHQDSRSSEACEADAGPAVDEDPRVTRAMHKRLVQRKAARSDGGAALGEETRRRMEPEFGGADLSNVRVHTGAGAADAASGLGARAFTEGRDLHFGAGQYRPGEKEGDRLIAHELTHVVEGHAGVRRKTDDGKAADGAEKKADAKADAVADKLHGADDVKQAPAPELKAGATGIINKDVTVKVGGKDTKLPNGTCVKIGEVIKDDLKVKVGSGFGGKDAVIKRADFEFQPGVAVDEDTGKEREDHYEEYKGSLWGKEGPKPDDIHQGYIGDCYLMAAMGAVVARNPGAIKTLFSPQAPDAKSYQVTLHVRGAGGKFEKVSFAVDTKLPTQPSSPQNPAYANNGNIGAPLWPALLEKAYAMMLGGYAKTGEGGSPGDAMEAIAGTAQDQEAMPDKDKLIENFRNYEKLGKAVDVSTIGSLSKANQTPFSGKGQNFSAHLTGDEGQDVEIVKGSMTIEDHKSKSHLFVFDSDGKFAQKDVIDKGSVDYGKGDVSLAFCKGKAPDDAKNLETSYDYRGKISKEYNLYANHAYIFVKTSGDTLILKNPWGMGEAYDPKPIPAAAFVKFFNSISSTTVPAPPADEKKKTT
jgi:hypothetical protein